MTTLNLPSRGGVFNHIVTLVRALDRVHFLPVVLYWSADPAIDLAKEIDDPEIAVHRLPALWSKGRLFVPALLSLRRWYARLGVDVVYSIFSYTDLVAAPAARAAGVRGVVSAIRGRLVTENNPRWERAVFRIAHPLAGRLVDRFVAVSQASAADAQAHMGVPARKCIVVTNGIDLTGAGPSPLPSSPVVGVVSRLQHEKGVDVLIRSVPQVLGEVPGTRFVVAGDGPDRIRLEQLAGDLGVSGAVDFLGWCPDIVPVIAGLTLLVIPSHREGVPWVLLEAMRQARPVVATAVGGIPEVLLDGETGRLVRPGDQTALARAIVDLLRDPPRLAGLGCAGRERVVRHFSLEATAEAFGQVFHDVASRRPL